MTRLHFLHFGLFQVLVTSRSYVEELRTLYDKIPNVLVSVESYFDLFYFSSEDKGSRYTILFICDEVELLPKLKCMNFSTEACVNELNNIFFAFHSETQ